MSRVLSSDPVSKKQATWIQEGDRIVVDESQDVEEVISLNREQFKLSDGSFKGDMHHVARIPQVVATKLVRKGILSAAGQVRDEKAFRSWLNDPDNRAWRTHPGRI